MTESGDFSVEEHKDLYRSLGPWDDLQNETFARAREYVKLVRSSLRDQPERYKAFTVIMKTIAETRYATEKPPWEDVLGRVKEVFAGYDGLIVGFHVFLPPDAQVKLDDGDEEDYGLRRSTSDVLPSQKESCSNCDDAATSQVQASESACGVVQDPEGPSVKNDEGSVRRSSRTKRKRLYLDEEVTVGTSNGKKSRIPRTEEDEDTMIRIRQGLSFFRNVKQRIDPSAYREFLRRFHAYTIGSTENTELEDMVFDSIEAYPDLAIEFESIVNKTVSICKPLTEESDDICQPEIPEDRARNQEKYMDLPLWEVALSNRRSITPSYWRLPYAYPIPLPTHRNKTDAEVLNDRYVSAATECSSGNHDRRRHRRVEDQYEKVVSKCEDDRYELDMWKSWLEAAIRYAEDKLEELCADKIQIERDEHNAEEDPDAEAKRNAKEMERKYFFRCVERIYGDQGLEVHDIIHNDPAKALPTVMSRLKQKLEELKVFIPQMESIWSDRILSKKKS